MAWKERLKGTLKAGWAFEACTLGSTWGFFQLGSGLESLVEHGLKTVRLGRLGCVGKSEESHEDLKDLWPQCHCPPLWG